MKMANIIQLLKWRFIHNIDEAEDDVLQEFSKEFQKKRAR